MGLRFAPDLPYRLLLDAEEHGELGDPLIEERPAMRQDERAPASFGDEVGAENGLADPGGRHEDAEVLPEQGLRGTLLDGREVAIEAESGRCALHAAVFHHQRHTVLREQLP